MKPANHAAAESSIDPLEYWTGAFPSNNPAARPAARDAGPDISAIRRDPEPVVALRRRTDCLTAERQGILNTLAKTGSVAHAAALDAVKGVTQV